VDVPTSFGRDGAYRIESLVGRGGFATVHKAYQASLDRYVALKILRPEVLQEEAALERFQREARVAARLSAHPNIVTIYDCGEQDGVAYLVLEYIEGTTLERRLDQPISATEIERIIMAVGSALDYAHAHQFVHRDVKPANVLLGDDGRIFLSDFGIAKLLDTVTAATGGVLGTVEYMSPEQILGATVDARSDVYTFGAMVYRMFAGRPPFEGSLTSVMYKHVNDPPPPLLSGGPPMPPAVDAVVRRALLKDPAERHASAGEFAAELAKALRPATLLERAQAALALNDLDQAELLASELLSSFADDAGGRYVSRRALRLREVIQVARILEIGSWQDALSEIDRLRLREADDPEAVDVVRRADQLRELENARIQVEQRLLERQRLEQEARRRAEAEAQARSERQRLEEELRSRTDEEARAQAEYERLEHEVQARTTRQHTDRTSRTGLTNAGDEPASVPPRALDRRPLPPVPMTHERLEGVGPDGDPSGSRAPLVEPPVGARARRTGGRRRLLIGLLALTLVLIGGGILAGTRLLGGNTAGTSLESPILPAPTTLAPTSSTAAAPAPTPAPTGISAPVPASAPTAATVVVTTSSPTAIPAAAAHSGHPTQTSPGASLAPPLASARHLHTATRLEDGRILVTGGREAGTPLDSTELYDPSTNAWASTASMSTARYRHTATLLPDGRVLMIGGQRGDGSFLDTAEQFDPRTNSWALAGRMTVARAGHTATLLHDGRVIVAGGYNTQQFHRTAELYDPSTGTWATAASMADIHSGHTATQLADGNVVVAGGFGTSSQATAERYDPAANAWTSMASMNDGRLDHTALLMPDGRVLVAGGVNSQAGGTYLSSAEIFDPQGNRWSPVAPMAGPRGGHTAAILPDGQALVAGGRDLSSSLSSAERYDADANVWRPAGTLAAARWLPAAAPLPDGRILLTGGRVGNSSLAFVEQYDPQLNDWAGAGQAITLDLTSQNNSGITGAATMTNMGGGKLRVEMHVVGAGPGPYPAHIHEGSCSQLNPAPRFPLTNVVDGTLVTDVDATLQLVTSSPHAIHMHKSPDEMPIYVACADTRVPG
jgi:tRNA A-37 threonylcarbamoyl transferase component Bud32